MINTIPLHYYNIDTGADDYSQEYTYEVEIERIWKVCAKQYMKDHQGVTFEEAYEIVIYMDSDELDEQYEEFYKDYFYDEAVEEYWESRDRDW